MDLRWRLKRLRKLSRGFIQYSPSDTLTEILKYESGADVQWELLEKVAKERTDRLPIITGQYMMMRNEGLPWDGLRENLPGASEWHSILKAIAPNGVDGQDIAHWAWILQAPSHDESIARFVLEDSPKPVFLLLFLLARSRNIRDSKVLAELFVYIANKFVPPSSFQQYGQRAPRGAVRQNLRPYQFGVLMSRLAYHSLKVWPSAIVSVAHVVAKWIISTPVEKENKSRTPGVSERNDMYNRAINLFQLSANIGPVQNMRYSWEAQRILLNLGNTLQPAMIINRRALRAIRKVLLALPKAGFESRIAERSSRTWPPFRQIWDGLDERRPTEEYLSRNIRAGVEAVKAGYALNEVDQALNALGGGHPGEIPTIQTRSLAMKLWTGRLSYLNVFSLWAARVKATRNAQEAWLVFQKPPRPGLEPNFQVYAEMFEKLVAREVPDETGEVPGDSKECWKMHTENLTEFEVVRLQPPTVDELYEQMIRGGNRPTSGCLELLVKNARSVKQGMGYLRDSPHIFDEKFLLGPNHLKRLSKREATASLRQFPPSLFNAWIDLLCRIHPLGLKTVSRENLTPPSTNIQVAISLTLAFFGTELREHYHENLHYKAPWHTILKALSGNKTLLSWQGPTRNHDVTLRAFLNVFRQATRFTGMDVEILKQMAFMSLKTLKAATGGGLVDPWDGQIASLMRAFHHQLVSAFHQSIEPVEARLASAYKLPSFYHDMTPALLRNYLRAMASYGDVWEFVRTADWILDAWNNDAILQGAKVKGSLEYKYMINKVLGYIKGMGDFGLVPEDEMQRLDNRMEALSARRLLWNGVEETYRWTWPESLSWDDKEIIRVDLAICGRWITLRKWDEKERGIVEFPLPMS